MIDFGSRTWPLLVLAAGDEPRQFLLLMGQQPFGSTPFFFFRCNVEAQEIRLECQRQGEKGASLATPTC